MCGEQGFIAMHETVHLVKFIGKSCSIFFRVLMLRYTTTGYKVLKYSSRIRMVYLAAQQQNKLIQFLQFVLVFANSTYKLDFL